MEALVFFLFLWLIIKGIKRLFSGGKRPKSSTNRAVSSTNSVRYYSPPPMLPANQIQSKNNTSDSSIVVDRATKKLIETAVPEKLPHSRKCFKIAEAKKEEAIRKIKNSYKADSITLYMALTDKARSLLNEAVAFEENAKYKNENNRPSDILKKFERDYQWKLRDAIETEEKYYIGEVKGPQRNNKQACCDEYLEEINAWIGYFSEETTKFAMKSYDRVCNLAGLYDVEKEVPPRFYLRQNNSSISRYNAIEQNTGYDNEDINQVDSMDGHQFEYFCANILRKNGYEKVIQTKGSGDQGVDIIAEKDGIKFAIQCKCYSSDLGNKPIQEAFAGKSVYNCQIAAVLTNRYFTPGAKQAAKATGVLLWDRNKLKSFIDTANQGQ